MAQPKKFNEPIFIALRQGNNNIESGKTKKIKQQKSRRQVGKQIDLSEGA